MEQTTDLEVYTLGPGRLYIAPLGTGEPLSFRDDELVGWAWRSYGHADSIQVERDGRVTRASFDLTHATTAALMFASPRDPVPYVMLGWRSDEPPHEVVTVGSIVQMPFPNIKVS